MKDPPDYIQYSKYRGGDQDQDGHGFEVHDSCHVKGRDSRKNQIIVFVYCHMSLHDPPCIYDDGRKQDKVDKYDVCPVVAYPTTKFLRLCNKEIDDQGNDKE